MAVMFYLNCFAVGSVDHGPQARASRGTGGSGGQITLYGAQAQAAWAMMTGQEVPTPQGAAAVNDIGGQAGFTKDQVLDAGYILDGEDDNYFYSHEWTEGDNHSLNRQGIKLVKSQSNEVNWYDPAGQINAGVGTFASALEVGGAGYSLGKNLQLYGPRSYAPLAMGARQFSRATFSIAGAAKGIGMASALGGVAMDGIGVYKYYTDPTSPNAVHPGKAGLNTGMSAYGIWINPVAGILYSGMDAFYPGGWPGYIGDVGAAQSELNQMTNYQQRLIPFGPK
jgi:hypothetical protein